MRLTFPVSVLAMLVMSAGAAQADNASWPDLFREAAIPKANDAPVAYDVEVSFGEASENGEEQRRLVYSVMAPLEGNRTVDLTSFPDNMDRDEILEDLADPDGDIWCDDYRDIVGGDVVLRSETDQTATFAFPANPDSAEDRQERKIMKKVQITVEVDKATKRVLNFHYALTEPVKPMVVAKVKTFEINGQCNADAGERPVVTSVEMKVSGSAMGQSFDQRTLQTHSNVRLLD